MNTINPGDRVSWRLDSDSRHFGTVIRCGDPYPDGPDERNAAHERLRHYLDNTVQVSAFQVIDTMGVYRVIPARFITKEVG